MTEQSHRFLDAHFEQHRETLIRVELCYWLIAPNDVRTTSVNITNNDGLHPMVEVGTQVALQAGTHALKVEFFERGGGAGLIMSIRGTDGVKRVVTAGELSRPVDCPADIDGDGELSLFDFLAFQNEFDAGCP